MKRAKCGGFFLSVCVCAVLIFAGCSSSGGGGNGAAAPYTPYVTNGPVFTVAVADDGTTYIGGLFTQVGPATGGGVPIDASTGQAPSSFPKIVGAVHTAAADGSGGMYIGGYFTYVGGLKRRNLAHILSDGTVDAAWDPSANGPVNALVASGSTVYAGGYFTSLGSSTTTTRKYLAALDATGAVTSWDPNANNEVYALAVSGNTVYAGGYFTTLGSAATLTTRNYIAAIDTTTGAATSWDPNANNEVYTLALSGNTVYVGGYFTTLGSAATLTTRNRIAAIDMATGIATTWDPSASDYVNVLAVNGNTVYAGGAFTALGSSTTITRNYLAAIDTTTGVATTWDPNANEDVNALVVSGNTVYAGGWFTTLGSSTTTTRNYIAAIDATTGAATSWDPNANEIVTGLAVNGSTVYAGGYFTSLGCSRRNNIAALDANGAVTSWDPNANGEVSTLAVSGNTVYAGGWFTTLGSSPTTTRNFIAALDRTSGAVTSWDPNANAPVDVLAVSGSTVYAAGLFTTLGSSPTTTRNFLAALDISTGATTSWDPNPNSIVNTLVVSGNTVYAGGFFTTLGSAATTTRNFIAALDTTTGAPTSWDPNPNAPVLALAVNGNTVYAGGIFMTLGSAPATERNFLAALDATTGTVKSWNPDPDAPVNALAVSGSTVYAAGEFSTIGSAPTTTRNSIAALDETGAATSWAPELAQSRMRFAAPAYAADAKRDGLMRFGPVSALTVSGNAVYIGGLFSGVGPEPLSYFGRLSK